MPTSKIRRIQPQENKFVLEIVEAFSPMSGFSWPSGKLESELGQAESWGIWIGQELGAFVVFRENAEAYEITVLGTRSERRRSGLMKTLLNHVIDARGHKAWWLEVHEENQAALRLYKALGFAATSWRRNYYPDGKAAILMSRNKIFSAP